LIGCALMPRRERATLPVSDLQRAKDFYADRLGLTPSSETPGGAFYDCADGTRFVLFPSRGAASGTHTQLGFAVTDIAAEVAELTSRISSTPCTPPATPTSPARPGNRP
jgi:catechol 2,3-dioxygenase-like lactoylglutathione lyase family enzyme